MSENDANSILIGKNLKNLINIKNDPKSKIIHNMGVLSSP